MGNIFSRYEGLATMSLDGKDKRYISEDDKFFHDFNQSHPNSLSQQQEIQKAEKIAKARDVAEAAKGPDQLWEGF